MARRAHLEFASATNNTHLAPTIHHRGLDHPGEGTTQPTSDASEPSTSGSSTVPKAHAAPGADAAKGAPSQVAAPGAVAGTSGANKKTTNNSRATGSGMFFILNELCRDE